MSDQAYELVSTHPAPTSWNQSGFQQNPAPFLYESMLLLQMTLVPSANGWLQFQAKLRPLMFRSQPYRDKNSMILGAGEMALWLLFQNPNVAAHHWISTSRETDTLAQTYMQYTWKLFNQNFNNYFGK